MPVGEPPSGPRLDGVFRLVIVESPDLAAPLVGALDAAAVGAWVHWLLNHSNWTVTEPHNPGVRVPVKAQHVCLLFRRFSSFGDDMARPYVNALEARGVPHLLVGGRGFHLREEVETFWTQAWEHLEKSLAELSEADLPTTVSIKGKSMTAEAALFRTLAHLAYHVGQIVLLARMQADEWEWITSPRK